jgi:hypothetical protein
MRDSGIVSYGKTECKKNVKMNVSENRSWTKDQGVMSDTVNSNQQT